MDGAALFLQIGGRAEKQLIPVKNGNFQAQRIGNRQGQTFNGRADSFHLIHADSLLYPLIPLQNP